MLRRKIAVPNGKGRVINSHVSAWVASNQPADLPLLSKALFLIGGIHSIQNSDISFWDVYIRFNSDISFREVYLQFNGDISLFKVYNIQFKNGIYI